MRTRSLSCLFLLSTTAACLAGPGSVNGGDDAPDAGGQPPSVDSGSGGTTHIAGDITADATWSGDLTADNVTIKAGVTVTVSASTHITFMGGAGLIVEGTLKIQGADGQLVTLDGSSWSGISVSSGGTLELAYADISKAGMGIECAAGAAGCTIDHAHLHDNVQSGTFASTVTITRSILEKTTSEGIYVAAGGNATITDTVLRTAGGDLLVQGGGSVSFDYGEIGDNDPSYEHCGIHINKADSLSIQHTDFRANVYGSMIGGTTNAKINFSNWSNNSTDVDDLGGNTGLDLSNNYWSKGAPTGNFSTANPSAQPLMVGPRP
jgi:hypothetical protein